MIVISHFYNEEYLLPHWLNHHKNIFDKGILINSNSNDKSVEIIKNITPEWEIVESPYLKFDSIKMDKLIMEIEESYRDEVKIVLNTTEFLFIENKEKFKRLLKKENSIYRIPAALMIDTKLYEKQIKDLTKEKIEGIWHDSLNVYYLNKKFKFSKNERARYIHNLPNGKYLPGRHLTYHKFKNMPVNTAYLRWYYFSPWNEITINRKLKIRDTISQNDIKNGLSKMHLIDEKFYFKTYDYLKNKIYNIPTLDTKTRIKILFLSVIRKLIKFKFYIKYSKIFRLFLRIIFPNKKIRSKISNFVYNRKAK